MKLKCNHARRVLVLPSGNAVHRSDGSQCLGVLTIGGNKVFGFAQEKDLLITVEEEELK